MTSRSERPDGDAPGPAAIAAVLALARAARLLERACDECSLAHYRVLSAIGAGDQRASRLAARLAVGKPTVSAAVDALSGRGLVTRSSVASDQRAVTLRLTPAGERLRRRVEARMVVRLAELCARTSEGERMLEVLAWLGDAIDEEAAARMRATAGSRA